MVINFTLTSKVSLTEKHRDVIGAAARQGAIDAANAIEEQIAMEILGVEDSKSSILNGD